MKKGHGAYKMRPEPDPEDDLAFWKGIAIGSAISLAMWLAMFIVLRKVVG